MTERTHRTLKKPEEWGPLFLDELRKTGNVSDACRAAGVGRRTVYDRRDRDAQFRSDWEASMEVAADALEAEAWRRAVRGIEEPVSYKGVECGRIRRYSDVLLIFLMKATRPDRYADRRQLTGKDGGAIAVRQEPVDLAALSDADLDQLERLLSAAQPSHTVTESPAAEQQALPAATVVVEEHPGGRASLGYSPRA